MSNNPNPGMTALTIERGILYDTLRAVEHTMSADMTRPHLAGALFVFSSDKLLVVTTDGHRLTKATRRLKDGSCLGDDRSVLIDAASVIKVRKSLRCKKSEADRDVSVLADESGLEIKLDGQTLNCKAVDAFFLFYGKVIPSKREIKSAKEPESLESMSGDDLLAEAYALQRDLASMVNVCPAYLADVGKAAAEFGCGGIVLQPVCGAMDPMRFDGIADGNGEIVIIVMPMRQ